MAAEVGENLVAKTFDDFEAGCSFIHLFLAEGFHLCKNDSRTTVG